jgi:ParB family chromosome partitioning protein
MKKGDAAATAELRLAGTGWLPEVLANRDASDGADNECQSDEPADPEDEEIPH